MVKLTKSSLLCEYQKEWIKEMAEKCNLTQTEVVWNALFQWRDTIATEEQMLSSEDE